MLRTRVLVGTLLAAVTAAGLIFIDAHYQRPMPFLFGMVLTLGYLSTREFIALLPAADRPKLLLTTAGVLIVLTANWLPRELPLLMRSELWPFESVFIGFVALMVAAFLLEMKTYTGVGGSLRRVAFTCLIIAYLGILPSFLVQIAMTGPTPLLALFATIAVPKMGDVAAYLTGRAVGRHPLAPQLSPKKTWEGFLGGMIGAMATAVGLSYVGPLFRHGLEHAIAFGFFVGLAGVFGDLAESMIKRDAMAKDASASIPGFGGVMDVIDSLLFAAPVAWLVLKFNAVA